MSVTVKNNNQTKKTSNTITAHFDDGRAYTLVLSVFFLNVRTKLTKPTHTWQPSSFFPYTLFLPIITFPVFSTNSLLSLHLPSSPSYTASSSSSSSLPPLSLLWAIRIHYRLS